MTKPIETKRGGGGRSVTLTSRTVESCDRLLALRRKEDMNTDQIAAEAAKKWCKRRGLGKLHIASLTTIIKSAAEKGYDLGASDSIKAYFAGRSLRASRAAERADVIVGLEYIANSPSSEHGGFHPSAVETAKAALKLLSQRPNPATASEPLDTRMRKEMLGDNSEARRLRREQRPNPATADKVIEIDEHGKVHPEGALDWAKGAASQGQEPPAYAQGYGAARQEWTAKNIQMVDGSWSWTVYENEKFVAHAYNQIEAERFVAAHNVTLKRCY